MATSQESNTATLSASQQIQRQAFYNGLTSILTEEQANDALNKWSAYITETGSAYNGLNNFAKEVCKNYAKDDQQRDLVRALNRALFNKNKVTVENIQETNKPPMAAEPGVETEPSLLQSSLLIDQPASTPDFQTFEYLLTRVLRLVKEQSSDTHLALRPFLNELIESMPWSETQQQQILILIDSGVTTLMRTYRPDQLKTFMKHLHSWLVDEMGKKEAEILWAAAIAETESQEHIKYSATNFA